MKIIRNWTHIRRIGLRIKPFESQGCYQSNGNPPDPQNGHRKFKIDQKSNGTHRPHCPLNLAINRMCRATTRIMNAACHKCHDLPCSLTSHMPCRMFCHVCHVNQRTLNGYIYIYINVFQSILKIKRKHDVRRLAGDSCPARKKILLEKK